MLPRLSAWPQRRSRHCRYQQVVEALESRMLLAGDVTAVVEDGNLTLTGDAEDNLVDVMVVEGDIVVQGLDGTTVNGSSDPFVAFPGTTTIAGDFETSLAGGPDTLRLFGPFTITGVTRVHDFHGQTRLGITDVTFEGAARITTGNGADEFSIADSTFGSDLKIRAGGDDNLVSIFETSVDGKTSISAGSTYGHGCWFSDWYFGGHHRGLGALMSWWHRGWQPHHRMWDWGHHGFPWHDQSGGDNQIVIEESTLADLHVTAGAGDDNIVLKDSTVEGTARGATGSGDDFVMTEGLTVGGKAVLHLSAGDDQLVTRGVNTFDDTAFASGGFGREDAHQLSDETVVDGASKLPHFELSSVPEEVIEMRGAATIASAADLRTILNAAGSISSQTEEAFVLV